MVVCDNTICKIPGGWVHGNCIGEKGISKSEVSKKAKWYCPDCPGGGSFFNCEVAVAAKSKGSKSGQKRKSSSK
jgi:hypothetical protein